MGGVKGKRNRATAQPDAEPPTGITPEIDPNAQPEPITLTIKDGTELVVPAPLPAEAWLWVFENCFVTIDPNRVTGEPQMTAALLDGIAVRAEEIISVATGTRLAELREADGLDEACVRLCAQMSAELRGASPFSSASVKRGKILFLRKMAVYGLSPALSGTGQPSQFSLKSAVDDGSPSGE